MSLHAGNKNLFLTGSGISLNPATVIIDEKREEEVFNEHIWGDKV